MQPSYFNKVMTFGVLLFGAIFAFVLFGTDPTQGLFVKVSFYLSLFVFLVCLYSLLSFAIKKIVSNNEVIYGSMKGSARQGILFSVFVVSSLLLASIGLLTWWDGLLLAFSLFLLELYFKSEKAVI